MYRVRSYSFLSEPNLVLYRYNDFLTVGIAFPRDRRWTHSYLDFEPGDLRPLFQNLVLSEEQTGKPKFIRCPRFPFFFRWVHYGWRLIPEGSPVASGEILLTVTTGKKVHSLIVPDRQNNFFEKYEFARSENLPYFPCVQDSIPEDSNLAYDEWLLEGKAFEDDHQDHLLTRKFADLWIEMHMKGHSNLPGADRGRVRQSINR